MNYNKTLIRNQLATSVRYFFTKYSGYYLYPKFRVLRDMNVEEVAYKNYPDNAIFVNLGAGEYFYHPRWKNYDFYEENLLKRIKHFNNYDLSKADSQKFPDSNVDAFYFAHTLEHVPSHLTVKVLSRIYDALKPGGILRIVVPDADLILKAYDSKNANFFAAMKTWFEVRGNKNPSFEDYLLQLIATPKCCTNNTKTRHAEPMLSETVINARQRLEPVEFLDFLVEGLRENEPSGADHLNWFTQKKLTRLCSEVGFSKSYASAFGQSECLPMKQVPLFDQTVPFCSLYFEAVK